MLLRFATAPTFEVSAAATLALGGQLGMPECVASVVLRPKANQTTFCSVPKGCVFGVD